jgi:hypothetical protein
MEAVTDGAFVALRRERVVAEIGGDRRGYMGLIDQERR